jgi:hypothetical protein
MSKKVHTHQGGESMRHWTFHRGLLGGTAILGLVFSWALMGCGDDKTAIGGLAALAATDGAALEGLTFDFPDATIFGFPDESATLEVGDDADTFTLTTSGGTVINGTITNGPMAIVSCRLTQNPAEVAAREEQFDAEYNTCEATIVSDGDIAFGESGNGTVTLRLGRADETPVESDSEEVILNLHDDGTVTINNNDTPI